MKALLTGNEALARGAWEAGVCFASAYPGTPSTEILEQITGYGDITAEWAPNEKTALESAVGASIGGVRALASMKHVGVNVAADPLFTASYTGVNAGLVLITADEPGQHSSQNEQDNRWYALSAKLPMFEPANSQECLDMMKAAYDVSERFDTPVLLRVTTRVCHSKSVAECGERASAPDKPYEKNPSKYVMVPSNAKIRRAEVEKREAALPDYAENSGFNYIIPSETGGKSIGVIASGACFHFAREVFGGEAAYLKLGFTNPLPGGLLAGFAASVDDLYIVEENDPYIENWVKSMGFACKGKSLFPAFGEMTPDILRAALGKPALPSVEYDRNLAVPRPPALCAGCPHRGLFYELGHRKNIVVSGDIGCYTLGFAPPYNAMDTCVCMGAAFSLGHGLQKALDITGQNKRVVGVMGDSTFFHTGINSLIEVVYNGSRTVCIILDNRITGMTGHQENPGTGKNAKGLPALQMDIEGIVRALGVELVRVVNPNDLMAVNAALDAAFGHDGPSVIITKWPCALKRMDAGERAAYGNPFQSTYRVNDGACIGCGLCVRCGCPALSFDKDAKKAAIDSACLGCGVCGQICPAGAIVKEGLRV